MMRQQESLQSTVWFREYGVIGYTYITTGLYSIFAHLKRFLKDYKF